MVGQHQESNSAKKKKDILFDANIIRLEQYEPNSPRGSIDQNAPKTAHDWQYYRHRTYFFDDGTKTFFWRTHTLTVLFLTACYLVRFVLFEEPSLDTEHNIKRGLLAVICVFILFGITQIPDGPFVRPHPVLWRLVLAITVIYELVLIFILFQTPDDARKFLRHVDPNLGKPLDEKDYGGSCDLYDPTHPSDPFHNIWDKMDVFVPTHFFGWWLKTLMIRDWWLCTVLSIMFEFMEYTLEHQLPNFSECWWDHWIMDALICNGGGILCGMYTLQYLSMKPYNWRGLWNIPTYRGKLKRIVAQFGPHSWVQFDWRPLSSFNRWMAIIIITITMLITELNTFYLKYVLWLEPPHPLNLCRLFLIVFAGAVALRELFQYLDDPECTKIGRQSWVLIAIILTELLIILKFDFEVVSKPLPKHIFYAWIGFFAVLTLYTLWRFVVQNIIKILYRTDAAPPTHQELSTETSKKVVESKKKK